MEANDTQQEAELKNQALIVQFEYGLPSEVQFFELDEMMRDAFLQFAPALYDGHEIAMDLSDGTFLFLWS